MVVPLAIDSIVFFVKKSLLATEFPKISMAFFNAFNDSSGS